MAFILCCHYKRIHWPKYSNHMLSSDISCYKSVENIHGLLGNTEYSDEDIHVSCEATGSRNKVNMENVTRSSLHKALGDDKIPEVYWQALEDAVKSKTKRTSSKISAEPKSNSVPSRMPWRYKHANASEPFGKLATCSPRPGQPVLFQSSKLTAHYHGRSFAGRMQQDKHCTNPKWNYSRSAGLCKKAGPLGEELYRSISATLSTQETRTRELHSPLSPLGSLTPPFCTSNTKSDNSSDKLPHSKNMDKSGGTDEGLPKGNMSRLSPSNRDNLTQDVRQSPKFANPTRITRTLPAVVVRSTTPSSYGGRLAKTKDNQTQTDPVAPKLETNRPRQTARSPIVSGDQSIGGTARCFTPSTVEDMKVNPEGQKHEKFVDYSNLSCGESVSPMSVSRASILGLPSPMGRWDDEPSPIWENLKTADTCLPLSSPKRSALSPVRAQDISHPLENEQSGKCTCMAEMLSLPGMHSFKRPYVKKPGGTMKGMTKRSRSTLRINSETSVLTRNTSAPPDITKDPPKGDPFQSAPKSKHPNKMHPSQKPPSPSSDRHTCGMQDTRGTGACYLTCSVPVLHNPVLPPSYPLFALAYPAMPYLTSNTRPCYRCQNLSAPQMDFYRYASQGLPSSWFDSQIHRNSEEADSKSAYLSKSDRFSLSNSSKTSRIHRKRERNTVSEVESANPRDIGTISSVLESCQYNLGCIILQRWFGPTHYGQKFEEGALLESNHPSKYEFLVNLEQGANSFKSNSMTSKMISLADLLPIEYHLMAEKCIGERQLPAEQSDSGHRFETMNRQMSSVIVWTLRLLKNFCAPFFKKSLPNHHRKADIDYPKLHSDEQINCNSNDNSDGELSQQGATGHYNLINSTTATKGQSVHSPQSLSLGRRGMQDTDKIFVSTCIVIGPDAVVNTRVGNSFASVAPEPDEFRFPSVPQGCTEALRNTTCPTLNPCSAIRIMRHPSTRKSCEVQMQRHCCFCCHCDLMNLQTFDPVEHSPRIRGLTEEHDQNRVENLRMADTGEKGSAVAAPSHLWGKSELDNREQADYLESKTNRKQEPEGLRSNEFKHHNPFVGKIPSEQLNESIRKTWNTAERSPMSLDSSSLKKGTSRGNQPCIYKVIPYAGSSEFESLTQVEAKFGSDSTAEAKANETKSARTENSTVVEEVFVEVDDEVSVTEVTGPIIQKDLVTRTEKSRNSPLNITKGLDWRDKVPSVEVETDRPHITNERSVLTGMEAISANVLDEHCLPVTAIMLNENRIRVKLQPSCRATEQKFMEPYKKETLLQTDIFEAGGHSLSQDEYSIIKSNDKSPVLLPIQQQERHMLESSADVSEQPVTLANKMTSRTSGYPPDTTRREEGSSASCDFKSNDVLKDAALSLRIVVASSQSQEARTLCPNTENGHSRSTHERCSDPSVSATSISVTYPSVFQTRGTDRANHIKLNNGQELKQKDNAVEDEGHSRTEEDKEYHVGRLHFTKSSTNECAPNGRDLCTTSIVTTDKDASSRALNEIAPSSGSLQKVSEYPSTGLVLSANTTKLGITHTEPTILNVYIYNRQQPHQNTTTMDQSKPQEAQSQMIIDVPLHVGISCDEKPQSQRYSALEFALSDAWPGIDWHQTPNPQDVTNGEFIVTGMKVSEAPMYRRLSKESLVGIPERSLLETLALSSPVDPPMMYDEVINDRVLPTQKTYSTLEFAVSETRAGLMFVSHQELHPQYSAKASLPTTEWLRVRRLSEASLHERMSKESLESIPEQPLIKQLGSSSLTTMRVDITHDGMLAPQRKHYALEQALSKAWAGITSHSYHPYKDTQEALSLTRGKLPEDNLSDTFTHHPLSKDSLAEIPEHPLHKLPDSPAPVSSSTHGLYKYGDKMAEDERAGTDLATVHGSSQQSEFKPVQQPRLWVVDHGFAQDEDEATKIKARSDKEPVKESDVGAASAVSDQWDEPIRSCYCRQLTCTACGCQFHRRKCGCLRRSRLHCRFGDQVLVELGCCLEKFDSIDFSKDHCAEANSAKPTTSIPIQRRLVCLCRPLPWYQWIRGPAAFPELVPSQIQSGRKYRRTFP
ncbi:hypothetical protein CSKR_101088 [Clonorchis sinensis]|uniref:Uncharacterized protein n=1 Tax=Clonorchis sinensis TaxID=79923 RepID=A0A3R7CR04_CLOSI|nr:hypothetical protein CSKR_101088 [Clonorchis sinensis]